MQYHRIAQAGLDGAKLVAKYPGTYVDAAWAAVRKFCFAVIFLALITAKMTHIYAHITSLSVSVLLVWGITFFLQDIVIIFLVRGLTAEFQWKTVRIAAAVVTIICTLAISGMASANISFYFTTGAEIHWHQAHNVGSDAAAIRTLLSGLTGFLIVEVLIVVGAYFSCNLLYNATGAVLHILGSSLKLVVCCWRRKRPDPAAFERIECQDYRDDQNNGEEVVDDDKSEDFLLDGHVDASEKTAVSLLKRLLVLFPMTVLFVLRCVRPPDPAFFFLSWSIPLAPLVDGRPHRGPPVEVSGLKGSYGWLTNQTALTPPVTLDWLPNDRVVPGFADWAPSSLANATEPPLHYNPTEDPIHISNLHHDVLEPLRGALRSGEVNIKHIIFIKLESTRADVFPLREDGYIWERILESYGGEIPDAAKERLLKIGRNAERLTGFPAALSKKDGPPKPYGGISARDAYTAGTYTLKSVVGSLCGVTPLVADFNREYQQHIYQPCLAHVFDALNTQNNDTDPEDYTTWPWNSKWMQSVTETYDHQDDLTPKMGYHDITDKESLNLTGVEEVNYYGYADNVLHDRIREALDDAEQNHRRLFLTHLTGTTHHPWGMPGGKYEDLLGSNWNNDNMNRYLNTIGFADGWLGEIMDMLEEKGVADETLLVMAGDHGLSLPYDNGITPYDNPRVGNFHVPLVLAHPKLPAVPIESPVINSQIAPTVLDLLIESASLGDDARHAAADVRALYEGQSMIRPLTREEKGRQDWQFSVMNTGGSWLSVRSADQPYRLVIPLINDVEWRFSNMAINPHEVSPVIKSFDVDQLAMEVERIHGPFAFKWVGEAAHVAQWWVSENWRRYRFDPDQPDKPHS